MFHLEVRLARNGGSFLSLSVFCLGKKNPLKVKVLYLLIAVLLLLVCLFQERQKDILSPIIPEHKALSRNCQLDTTASQSARLCAIIYPLACAVFLLARNRRGHHIPYHHVKPKTLYFYLILFITSIS